MSNNPERAQSTIKCSKMLNQLLDIMTATKLAQMIGTNGSTISALRSCRSKHGYSRKIELGMIDLCGNLGIKV